MKKLWKAEVNNWGWILGPGTFYFESRKEAEDYAKNFPAYNVEYAGRFTDDNADYLTGKIDKFELLQRKARW